MEAKEIKKKARERARERKKENLPKWTLKFEEIKGATERENIVYRQEIKRYSS